MTKPKILAFAGSLRKGSFNKMLLNYAVQGATEAGAEVTVVDLAEYQLPIYDGDAESHLGIPADGLKLKNLFAENDGLLLASPEYNGFFSGVMKNTIDWVSRKGPGEEANASFSNKWAAVVSASPGPMGGMRAVPHLQHLLLNLKCKVLPESFSLVSAGAAFDEGGLLKDESKGRQAQQIGSLLVNAVRKFNA
jgi:chromate reductase